MRPIGFRLQSDCLDAKWQCGKRARRAVLASPDQSPRPADAGALRQQGLVHPLGFGMVDVQLDTQAVIAVAGGGVQAKACAANGIVQPMLRPWLLRIDLRRGRGQPGHQLGPQLELPLLGGCGVGGHAGLLAARLGPIVGLGHHLKLGCQRRIANAPQLYFHRKKAQFFGGVLVQKFQRRHMLGPERLGHPNHLLGPCACCVGEDLAQVRVVGLFQLVFDDDLVIPAGAQNVELELTDPVLGGHQLQVGQTQRIGQRVEVVLFGQPGREVVGFVLPGFAQGDAFEFAEMFFHLI